MAKRSRLKKSIQKKSRSTFIFSVIGIIILIILLFRFGIPFLSDVSYFFGQIINSTDVKVEESKKEAFVPIPELDLIPSTTNEKELLLEGATLSGLKVEFYLNGEIAGVANTDESGHFEFEITLTDGDNLIKARAVKNETKSDFTRTKTVVFKESGPKLTIEFPTNGAEIKGENPIEVRGSTDSESSVLVNDFQAIIKSDGKWNYFLTLTEGDNEIKIISTDTAGNETEETIRVVYSR